MPRHMPFQYSQPVFVKIPFTSRTKHWDIDDHYPWQELGVTEKQALSLYKSGFIYHNPNLEKTFQVGDGLEALDIEALHDLVKNINDQVKAKTRSANEAGRKKCAKSKIKAKQIGHIRRWRNIYGDLEG